MISQFDKQGSMILKIPSRFFFSKSSLIYFSRMEQTSTHGIMYVNRLIVSFTIFSFIPSFNINKINFIKSSPVLLKLYSSQNTSRKTSRRSLRRKSDKWLPEDVSQISCRSVLKIISPIRNWVRLDRMLFFITSYTCCHFCGHSRFISSAKKTANFE